MNKKLLLMRHGKSDWSTEIGDFERPLNRRGCRDVSKMADELHRLGWLPDLILCSAAVRTTETSQLIQQSLGLYELPLEARQELYLASGKEVLETMQRYLDAVEACLLLVGHNPGLDDVVSYLCEEPPMRTVTGKLMTTAAVAAFDVTSNNDAVEYHLQRLLRPKEIS